METWNRRRMLQATLAASASTLCPWGNLLAQTENSLLRAKKQALVIGNNKYKDAPLKNPVNDAQGMAAALKDMGFEVTLGLELTQEDMRKAISAYGDSLIKSKAVGFFYFAGHGLQLAWRNYLIPIDADIVHADELRERAVDMNSVTDRIRQAGNPMNVIVLDACRDNPFGARAGLDQKGLSQLDAPPGTLLAYATAPGNTASDGEGKHGLYTEHLLQEIQVPEVKIEDVFKRVRLGVRRRSNGLQIPWESTSLEQDFWFRPPKQVRKAGEEEVLREFNEELALWERIQSATDPGPFEDYLRRNPSGVFSEVAQLRLDRALARLGERKIEIVNAAANPFTRGTGRLDIRFKVGDAFRYRELDPDTTLEKRTYTYRVTEVSETEVVFNNGRIVNDLLGNTRKQLDGDLLTQSQIYIPEYSVGKKWTTRYKLIKPDGRAFYGEYELKVMGREMVSVPAGTFNAFHVEGRGWGEESRAQLNIAYWVTPEIGRFVARNYKRVNKAGKTTSNERTELVSYPRR